MAFAIEKSVASAVQRACFVFYPLWFGLRNIVLAFIKCCFLKNLCTSMVLL